MVKYRSPVGLSGLRNPRAREELRAHLRLPRDLRRRIAGALEATNSTGCSSWELERIHRSILVERPTAAIEFGSGISTMVIADAVRRLGREGHATRFVTMEQDANYQDNMLGWFPDDLRRFVNFRLSGVVAETSEDGSVGYRYADTPLERFDWCFVDGPQLPRKDPSLFDSDVLLLPRGHRMVVHIDGRESTVTRLQQGLGPSVVERFVRHSWTTLVVADGDTGDAGRD
jgi:hypothetical protein